ncbi:MAG: dephospho-CoA kinase [Planctomycetota bacterium]
MIGLLGGIAAGKTTVAEMLGRLGATVLSADAIAQRVLERPETRDRVVARWGEAVVGDDGKVDRERLAAEVFGEPEELAALEAITHPAIVTELRQQIDAARRSQETVAVVVDAPLLLEADLDGLCDLLVFVECPRPARLARARDRGWDAAQLDRREGHQQPLEAKREQADVLIDGNAPLKTTFRQVQQLWRRTLGL